MINYLNIPAQRDVCAINECFEAAKKKKEKLSTFFFLFLRNILQNEVIEKVFLRVLSHGRFCR